MPEVVVTGRDGEVSTIAASNGSALMEVLREAGTGIEGTCGGAMSCGTCHVYVAPEWAARLSPRSEDEAAMLEAIGDFVALRPHSRLSCQIPLAERLSGLCIEVAPAV